MLALSAVMFSTACATDRAARLAGAHAEIARAGLVEDAVAIAEAERAEAREIADLPEDCRRRERSGVSEGERLDAALLRTDAALGRANARIARCADWHEHYRAGRSGAR